MSARQLKGPTLRNAHAVKLSDIPATSLDTFLEDILFATDHGARISALFGQLLETGQIRLWAILSHDDQSSIQPLCTDLEQDSYPSLTPHCPQAHLFEREIHEQWEVEPQDHPWLKPVRFHRSYRRDRNNGRSGPGPQIGETRFFRVEGEEIHEVAVGPVHAGIIEPGHFRFQCHGEDVVHLEISLGYQHRGIECLLGRGPDQRGIHYAEILAGDTSVGHASAYSMALEALAGDRVPARAMVLRGVALELERIANHIGDLGALAGDVGFLPTLSYCGRIRGDALNMTGLLCGNRFGRGFVKPGGVNFDLDQPVIDELLKRLDALERDVAGAVNLLWDISSVMARFEETGIIDRETCEQIGLVGPVARACGVERDIRRDMPAGIFQFVQIPISTWNTGDVFARAYVRWLEIQRSIFFIREQLGRMPSGKIATQTDTLAPNSLAVSMVEGWRGELCHVAITDANGRFSAYKIVDASFHNWFGLAIALRDQQISDFPLCNKSFNLSYCGHDL